MYEMFSRTNLRTFSVLRNFSQIIFVALTNILGLAKKVATDYTDGTDESKLIFLDYRICLICAICGKKYKPQAYYDIMLALVYVLTGQSSTMPSPKYSIPIFSSTFMEAMFSICALPVMSLSCKVFKP